MKNLRVNVIVLAIIISCINNSDSESVKETNLQEINSNDGLKTRSYGIGEETVETTKGRAGNDVRIIDDNITGQENGTPNILVKETVGKGTPNLTAKRSKRNKPPYVQKRFSSKKRPLKLARKWKRRTRRPKSKKPKKTDRDQDRNVKISYQLKTEAPWHLESEHTEYRKPLSSYRTSQILDEINKRLYHRDQEPTHHGSSIKGHGKHRHCSESIEEY